MTQTQLYKNVHVFHSLKRKLAQKLIFLLEYPNYLISFPLRWCQHAVLMQDVVCGAREEKIKTQIFLSPSRLLQPFKRWVYSVLSTPMILIVVFAVLLATPVSKGKLNNWNRAIPDVPAASCVRQWYFLAPTWLWGGEVCFSCDKFSIRKITF